MEESWEELNKMKSYDIKKCIQDKGGGITMKKQELLEGARGLQRELDQMVADILGELEGVEGVSEEDIRIGKMLAEHASNTLNKTIRELHEEDDH